MLVELLRWGIGSSQGEQHRKKRRFTVMPPARFKPTIPVRLLRLIRRCFKSRSWGVVTPCSGVVGYQSFGGPCSLHLQSEVKLRYHNTNTTRLHNPKTSTWQFCRRFEVFTAVKIQVKVFWPSPWRWRQNGSPKRWYPITILHGVTTQKTSAWKRHNSCVPAVKDHAHLRPRGHWDRQRKNMKRGNDFMTRIEPNAKTASGSVPCMQVVSN
jgi:hypothetical protein